MWNLQLFHLIAYVWENIPEFSEFDLVNDMHELPFVNEVKMKLVTFTLELNFNEAENKKFDYKCLSLMEIFFQEYYRHEDIWKCEGKMYTHIHKHTFTHTFTYADKDIKTGKSYGKNWNANSWEVCLSSTLFYLVAIWRSRLYCSKVIWLQQLFL